MPPRSAKPARNPLLHCPGRVWLLHTHGSSCWYEVWCRVPAAGADRLCNFGNCQWCPQSSRSHQPSSLLYSVFLLNNWFLSLSLFGCNFTSPTNVTCGCSSRLRPRVLPVLPRSQFHVLQPKSIRRTMTKRSSVIDFLDNGAQVRCVCSFFLLFNNFRPCGCPYLTVQNVQYT